MVAFLLWTTVSKALLSGGAPGLFLLGPGLVIILCSVTLTIVAFLCTVTCLDFGSLVWCAIGGEGDWEDWFWVSEPGKLADLLTFLEEMVMEEKPALF